MDRIRKFVEFKINITTIISLLVLVASFAAGYGKLWASHNALATEVHAHFDADDAKFAALATKETRAMRDNEVNAKFDLILKQMEETNRRLERIERLHLRP